MRQIEEAAHETKNRSSVQDNDFDAHCHDRCGNRKNQLSRSDIDGRSPERVGRERSDGVIWCNLILGDSGMPHGWSHWPG